MKALALIMAFMLFSIFRILFANSDEGQPDVSFPVFDLPDITFLNLTGGCGGFTDCIEYVGAVIFNIGAGIIFLVLVIVELFVFVIDLVTLLVRIQFVGITGAPFWVNAIFNLFFAGVIALLLYKLIRSGSSEGS